MVVVASVCCQVCVVKCVSLPVQLCVDVCVFTYYVCPPVQCAGAVVVVACAFTYHAMSSPVQSVV